MEDAAKIEVAREDGAIWFVEAFSGFVGFSALARRLRQPTLRLPSPFSVS